MKEAGRIEREEAAEGWQKQDLTSIRKGRS